MMSNREIVCSFLSIAAVLVLLFFLMTITGCDKVNNASRTMDTMLGGDYQIHVLGFTEPFEVKGGKVTSVPAKGYYVFYPVIKGKEKLVQSPINTTTVIKVD